MALRINNNAPSYMAANNLQKVMKELNSVQERLTTGQKINKASDGPAALVIGKRFEAQLGGIDAASNNVQRGMDLFNTADKTLETVEGLLIKAKKLALDSMDGTKTDDERTANNQELTEIIGSIDRIANNTTFGTKKLLDGSFAAQTFQIGEQSGVTYTASINDMRATALGINASTVDTAANATTALTAIDDALADVTNERGRIGGIVSNTFESTLNNLKIQKENLESARSSIMDTNYEEDTANMQKLNVRMQVASALLAATSQQSGLVLNLLG